MISRFAHTVALFVFLLLPVSAMAEERITRFSSDIAIAAPSGDLTIHESIEVTAESGRIQHGIFRDFPSEGFHILEVKRDGEQEPYSIESSGTGVRIRIGNADRNVPPGPHRYEIAYTATGQIRFNADNDADALYWDVTGNGWEFPIDLAEATIHLPQGAALERTAFYTGAAGSIAQDAKVQASDPWDVSIVTTKPLEAREGLTVAIGFSKDAVGTPAPVVSGEAVSLAVILGGLLVLGIYYLLSGFRSPLRTGGGISLVSTPPRKLSAAAMRYAWLGRIDNKTFVAAIVGMAAKGFLTIATEGGKYTVKQAGKTEADSNLSPAEAAVASTLFANGDQVEIEKIYSPAVANAMNALSASLRRGDEGVFRNFNFRGLLIGAGITLATVVLLFILTPPSMAGFAAAGVIGQVILVLAMFALKKTPTPKGEETLREIAGFRSVLAQSGDDKLFPYLLALDLEHTWSMGLESATRASSTANSRRLPNWYHGPYNPAWHISMVGFEQSLAFAQYNPATHVHAGTSTTGGFSGGAAGGSGGGW